MKDKVIWYGIGKTVQSLFQSVHGLLDYVEYFVDERYTGENFLNRKVEGLDIFRAFVTNPVVVSMVDKRADERISRLIQEYNLNTDQIWRAGDWAAYILSSDCEVILRPEKVRLEACTICQLNCPSCYMRVSNYGTAGKGYLRFDDFKKFADEHGFIKKIELSNSGEVFLNPDLLDILKYGYERGLEFTISNGVNFNFVKEDVLEGLVRYAVKRITISIDGASQSVYSMYRVNGNYDAVISNIKKVIDYKQKYGSSYPELIWQYILMEHNEFEAGEAKRIAQDLGIKIFYKLDWAGRFEPKDPERLEKVTGLHIFNREAWEEHYGKKYTSDMCRQLLLAPQIHYDGRLLGCCGVYLNDWNVNVFEKGLENSLNCGEYFRALLDFMKGDYNQQLDSICQNCSARIHNAGERQILEL